MKYKFLNGLTVLTFLVFCSSCNNRNNERQATLKPSFPDNESKYYGPDTVSGHFHNPDAKRDIKWPEHPSGRILMKTNNLGFRNDSPTLVKKLPETIRIIITGDSHTDGVIYNSESVASRLKEMLELKHPEINYEILNAGNGYFGPQNYLGVYKKFLLLQPDYFIVIVYTGNDFLDGIRIESENSRLIVPERKDDYYQDLWKVDKQYPGFTGQYLNQVKFFKSFPQLTETAAMIMKENLEKINILCKKNDTRLLVVLLPSKIDSEFSTDSIRIAEVFKAMKLTEKDIPENRKFTDSLKDWMANENLPYVDLLEPFQQSDQELFWKADYHVNHLGHKEMAKQIMVSGFLTNNQ
jgi:hypothetical protein